MIVRIRWIWGELLRSAAGFQRGSARVVSAPEVRPVQSPLRIAEHAADLGRGG
jgi:hypothetical protein